MQKHTNQLSRRNFINGGLAATAGMAATCLVTQPAVAHEMAPTAESLMVIGPLKGYSPQIGTLVSMMLYNRDTVVHTVKDLTMEQLDHLFDDKANTIGALLMHLGATDKFYQINTFDGRQEFNEDEKKEWGAAMELGDLGRKEIRGHDVQYYLEKIAAVREKTLAELKTKNDKWLLEIDPIWSKRQPVNTYWKWFHVCEHESNHRGQITWLKSRLPGAKPGKE